MTQDGAGLRNRSARLAGLTIVASIFGLGFASTMSAKAGDGPGDLPDLARPSESPPIISTPAPTQPRAAKPPGDRAVLALPGITTPGSSRSVPSTPPVVSSPSVNTAPDGLQLDAPLEMKGAPSSATPLPRVAPSTSPSRSARPLILETPDEEPIPIDGPTSRSNPSTKRPTTAPRVDPQPPIPVQRRGRLFGLIPAPAPALSAPSPTVSGSSMTGKTNLPGRSVVEGPQGDVAAESALKRRIEKQAREVVGDRARSIEVRIVGKVAYVQARGVKLLQKRGVRKSLELMPGVSGMKTSIEILD